MSSRLSSPPPPPAWLETGDPHPPPDPASDPDDASSVPWPWRLYAALTAYLGLPVIAGWIVAAVLAVMFLPDFGAASGFGLIQLVPTNTPALRAQETEQQLFGSSLADSPALVVEHAARGLPPATLVNIARQAQSVDGSHPASAPANQPSFALPLVNVPGLVSASRTPGTTTVTFLFFPSTAQSGDISAGAARYATAAPRSPGASVGVTGPVPAQISEGNLIENALVLLEVVTVAVIAVLVGVLFRSPVAPLVPLAGAGIAYLITRHILGWGAHLLNIQIPSQLSPIMIVLILGVVTDYSVFTLTGMRGRLAAGERRTTALRHASSRVVPLVIAAALTVAAGTIALVGADLDFFHAVGPGMAVAVIISGLVSISFVPALTGVLGRVAFWPSLPRRTDDPPKREIAKGGARRILASLISKRWAAAITAVVSAAVLVVAASGLIHARLGTNVISGLPTSSEPRQAADDAAAGFGPGIVGPTTLVLEGSGIAAQQASLTRLEQCSEAQPRRERGRRPWRAPPERRGIAVRHVEPGRRPNRDGASRRPVRRGGDRDIHRAAAANARAPFRGGAARNDSALVGCDPRRRGWRGRHRH